MSAKIENATPRPWNWIESKTLIHIETDMDNPHGAGIPVCSVPKRCKANADLIVTAVNEYDALNTVASAANVLMDAIALSDKQWIGLNMCNPAEKKAYEILTAGKIAMEEALSALTKLREQK